MQGTTRRLAGPPAPGWLVRVAPGARRADGAPDDGDRADGCRAEDGLAGQLTRNGPPTGIPGLPRPGALAAPDELSGRWRHLD